MKRPRCGSCSRTRWRPRSWRRGDLSPSTSATPATSPTSKLILRFVLVSTDVGAKRAQVVSDDDHHARLDNSVPFSDDRSETLPLTIVTRSRHAAIGSASPDILRAAHQPKPPSVIAIRNLTNQPKRVPGEVLH